MYTALRTLAAILGGMLVTFILVVALEVVGSVVHPVPPDFGGTNEEMCRHVERIPQWFLAVAVPAWGVAAFAGTWIAQRIGNLWSFAFVGILLLVALMFNISTLPYPMWFKVANLVVMPIAIVLGSRLAIRRQAAGPSSSQ